MDTNKGYFIKITNSLFYTTNEGEQSILEDCDYNPKTLSVLDYLYTNTNRKGISYFTLEDIIKSSGFEFNSKKTKQIKAWKDILVIFQERGLITSSIDMSKIKSTNMYYCNINIDLSEKFSILYESEKDIILNQSFESVDKTKLLIHYCYLKSRMYKRNVSFNQGKAEVCFPSFVLIEKETKLNQGVIKKYNDILVSLNLIRIDNAGRFYNATDRKKTAFESANTYVLYKNGWQQELEKGIKEYKNLGQMDGKVFIGNREYTSNNKSLNGKKGRLQRLINDGQATEKHLEEMEEIIRLQEENSGSVFNKISSIFNEKNNEGKLLSVVLEDLGDRYAFKYSEIEDSLDLLDKNNNLLIDYDYYKWVMLNYCEDKHDYYYNCVQNQIEENSIIDFTKSEDVIINNNILDYDYNLQNVDAIF